MAAVVPPDPESAGLSERVAALTEAIEKASLAEYVELVRRPWRTMWLHFVAGIARGLGMAVGFTILGAVVIYLLQHMVVGNLPVIGSALADLVRLIQLELRSR